MINVLVLLASFALTLTTVLDGLQGLPFNMYINVAFLVSFLCMLKVNAAGYHTLSAYLLTFLNASLIFYYSTLFGPDHGSFLFQFLIFLSIPFVVDFKRKRHVIILISLVVISLVTGLLIRFPWRVDLPEQVLREAFLGNIFQVSMLIIAVVLVIYWSNDDVMTRVQRAMKSVESMLEQTSFHIWSVDRQFRLIQANDKFKKFLAHRFGVDPQPGLDMLSLVPDKTRQFWKERYERGLAGEKQEFTSRFDFIDGSFVISEVSLFPNYNEDDVLTALTIYSNNVTEKQLYADALAENRELLTDAMELARLGTWRSDLSTGTVYWDERCCQIFGVEFSQATRTPSAYYERIHPDDLLEISQKLIAFEQIGGELLLNHRIITPSGEIRFIHEKASATRDSKGEISEIRGFIQDVTELRQQQAVEQRAALLLGEIKKASETLLVDTNFDHAFQEAIQLASNAIGASHAWVFRHLETEEGQVARLVTPIDATRVGSKERILLKRGVNYEKFGLKVWLERIQQGESLSYRLHELPEKEREVLSFFNVMSVMVLPVFVDKKFWGFIGFDDLSQERQWSVLEENILRGFCNALGGAISQQLTQSTLREAKELAEQATQTKSNFLSNISHEIRTPMNAIIGLTELMLPDEEDPQKLEYLEAVRFSADNLLRLINDLLDLSKIEADKIELSEEVFNLKEQLLHFERTLGYIARDKSLQISLEMEEPLPRLLKGDTVRLSQILLNLGSNAVKFTHAGKIEIKVSCKQTTAEKQLLRIEISDTGIGIDANKIERIFDRFEQAEKYTSRKFGGTGLGLTITQKLVKLMGGKIEVKSIPGKGSVFTVNIPFAQVSDPNREVTDPQTLAIQSLSGYTVLLVEDNHINIMLASRLLKKWDCTFEVAENGLDALYALQKTKFNLILLDIQMPVMNGFELIAKVRSGEIREDIRRIPVIALTADAFEDTKTKADALGFDDFITKPIKSLELYQKMSRLLKREGL